MTSDIVPRGGVRPAGGGTVQPQVRRRRADRSQKECVVEILSSRLMIAHGDRVAATTWWTEVLGLRIFREYGRNGQVLGTVLYAGGGLIELAGGGVPAAALSDGYVLWLQVPDIDTEIERLDAAGATIDERPVDQPWGLREARIRDPEGIGIVLVEIPDDHPIRSRLT